MPHGGSVASAQLPQAAATGTLIGLVTIKDAACRCRTASFRSPGYNVSSSRTRTVASAWASCPPDRSVCAFATSATCLSIPTSSSSGRRRYHPRRAVPNRVRLTAMQVRAYPECLTPGPPPATDRRSPRSSTNSSRTRSSSAVDARSIRSSTASSGRRAHSSAAASCVATSSTRSPC